MQVVVTNKNPSKGIGKQADNFHPSFLSRILGFKPNDVFEIKFLNPFVGKKSQKTAIYLVVNKPTDFKDQKENIHLSGDF